MKPKTKSGTDHVFPSAGGGEKRGLSLVFVLIFVFTS